MTIKTVIGNISGSKATLNQISSMMYEAGQKQEAAGFHALAEEAFQAANEIYEGLAATGYYDKK